MEKILKDKFGLSKLVICTDGGLSSYENRKNDSVGDRSFITVQSLKKLKTHLQEWALDSKGWHIVGAKEKEAKLEYDISTLDSKEYYETLFYKERWDPTPMSTGETLEQRIIQGAKGPAGPFPSIPPTLYPTTALQTQKKIKGHKSPLQRSVALNYPWVDRIKVSNTGR